MSTDTAVKKEDHNVLKIKMLNWADRFSIFCLLDNNGYNFEDPEFECLLATGCERSFNFAPGTGFEGLQAFFDASPSWLFGHLSYNAAGNAYAEDKPTDPDFGRGFFFEPENIIRFAAGKFEVVKSRDPDEIIQHILLSSDQLQVNRGIQDILSVTSREKYLQDIARLQEHIHRGDCYEINYCREFYSAHADTDPIAAYIKLTEVSPAPFGAFYKLDDKYCLCASPERFLKKTGRKLISQPIKGTARRDLTDWYKDEFNKAALLKSEKDKSENVMVVDIVRNDMSIVCKKDSVKVTELFGIYSFPQVHQMISTVEGVLAEDKNFTQAIEACYPMGSMTGAPKKRVMGLIEKFEQNQRGLFSGSVGYITPDGDFDLNVIIRSLFYDRTKKSISFFAGSGITAYSKAEDEYDECTAKAEAIFKILQEGG